MRALNLGEKRQSGSHLGQRVRIRGGVGCMSEIQSEGIHRKQLNATRPNLPRLLSVPVKPSISRPRPRGSMPRGRTT